VGQNGNEPVNNYGNVLQPEKEDSILSKDKTELSEPEKQSSSEKKKDDDTPKPRQYNLGDYL
jgi:hypothetical protein